MTLSFMVAILAALLVLPLSAQTSDAPPRIVVAAASSTLPDPQKPGHYALDKLYDGDPRTAWVEGKADDGLGEWVDLTIDPPVSASELRIMPGYFVPKVWEENNRVKAVTIELTDDRGAKRIIRAELVDKMEPQTITLTNKDRVRVKRVRLTITAVYPGTVYKDTPIADLAFYAGTNRQPLWVSPVVKDSPAAGGYFSFAGQVDDGEERFGEDGSWEYHFTASLEEKHGLHYLGVWSWNPTQRSVTITTLYRSWVRGVGKSHQPDTEGALSAVAPVYESYVDESEWVSEQVTKSWWSLSGLQNRGPFSPPPLDPSGIKTSPRANGTEQVWLKAGEVVDVYDRPGGTLLDHLTQGMGVWVVADSLTRISDKDPRVWGIVRSEGYPSWLAWAALPESWLR